MKKIVCIVGAIFLFSVSGCYNDTIEELYPMPAVNGCDTAAVTYTNMLKPIIDNQCATSGCHAGFAPTAVDLSNYSGVRLFAENGKLMAALNHTGPSPMPKDMPKLDPCTIAKFQAWINNNTPQ